MSRMRRVVGPWMPYPGCPECGADTQSWGGYHCSTCGWELDPEETEERGSVNENDSGWVSAVGDSLGEQYPREQARCREVLGIYRSLGPVGRFGALMIEDMLQRADRAAIEGDVVAMLGCFHEMQETK